MDRTFIFNVITVINTVLGVVCSQRKDLKKIRQRQNQQNKQNKQNEQNQKKGPIPCLRRIKEELEEYYQYLDMRCDGYHRYVMEKEARSRIEKAFLCSEELHQSQLLDENTYADIKVLKDSLASYDQQVRDYLDSLDSEGWDRYGEFERMSRNLRNDSL